MSTTHILIIPAADCPAPGAEIPPARAKPTRATVEYDLLMARPYALTHKDFSHAVHVAMSEVSGKTALSFDAFHAKGQPCMRASPLTKRYGWAAHYDGDGRLALVDPASTAFTTLSADPDLPRAQAMRSKRV